MRQAYLIFDVSVARAAESARPAPVAAHSLVSFFGVLCDERGAIVAVRRATVHPGYGAASLPDERALLLRLLEHTAEARCLITYGGRDLIVPLLELRALAHGLPMPRHFGYFTEDGAYNPYRAGRSVFDNAAHFDLGHFLADGSFRARYVGDDLLYPLAYPSAGRALARDDSGREAVSVLRLRVARQYALFLAVQHLRGVLDERTVAETAAKARARFLAANLPEAARAMERWLRAPDGPPAAPSAPPPVRTALDEERGGFLAFDIETVLDRDGGARALGLPPSHPALKLRLKQAIELGRGLEVPPIGGAGAEQEAIQAADNYFFPPPLQMPVSLALCWLSHDLGRAVVDHLTLGCTTRGGSRIENEAQIVAAFWRLAEGKVLISFNGRGFDLPVLINRALLYRISAPWFFRELRPPHQNYRHPQSHHLHFDVREFLRNGGRSSGALNLVARLCGLPGKFGVDGSQVAQMIDERRHAEVGRYCLSDAVQTSALALHVRHLAGWLDDADLERALGALCTRVLAEPELAEFCKAAESYLGRWRPRPSPTLPTEVLTQGPGDSLF